MWTYARTASRSIDVLLDTTLIFTIVSTHEEMPPHEVRWISTMVEGLNRNHSGGEALT